MNTGQILWEWDCFRNIVDGGAAGGQTVLFQPLHIHFILRLGQFMYHCLNLFRRLGLVRSTLLDHLEFDLMFILLILSISPSKHGYINLCIFLSIILLSSTFRHYISKTNIFIMKYYKFESLLLSSFWLLQRAWGEPFNPPVMCSIQRFAHILRCFSPI